jgi:hypothetical protein
VIGHHLIVFFHPLKSLSLYYCFFLGGGGRGRILDQLELGSFIYTLRPVFLILDQGGGAYLISWNLVHLFIRYVLSS